MFSNFIYFILALLIFTIYRPTDQPVLGPWYSLWLAIILGVVFYLFVRSQFKRLVRLAEINDSARMDHYFSASLTRQSILALVIYAIDIHGLNLPSHLPSFALLEALPTLRAMVFITIFILYLVIVWYCAYSTYEHIYGRTISRRQYLHTQIALSLPVLLPWLLLSGFADLIRLLPYDWSRNMLDTPAGQAVYFSTFLALATIFGPVLVQKFWKCRPLGPGELRQRIVSLTRRAGLVYREILLWPIFGGQMITAGVMGIIGRFRYILVTEALGSLLEPEEIDAVVAHEIGHIKKKHLWFYLFFFIGFMVVSYASLDLIVYLLVFTQFLSSYKFNPATLASLLYAALFFVNVVIYFRFVFGYFMRNFERQADTYVFRLFNTAIPLITTFQKIIEYSGQAADKPNWHHFSIAQRIEFLYRCERKRSLITRHDRKIKRSIIVYCLVLAILSTCSWQLNYGQFGQRLNLHLFERLIASKQPHTPEDAGLYFMIGNAYYEIHNLQKAAEAYEKSLQLKPGQPEVINNLAWLLATAEDPALRNEPRALQLATRAATLKPAPHILDTLAQALFVNGRLEQAIKIEKQALSKAAPDQRALYRRQLDKFIQALGNTNGGQ